jgi:hypothetical protein
MKGSFVAGLKEERIKYVVKARGEENSLAQLVETALQEESEVKSQRFKGTQGNTSWPSPGNSGGLRRDYRPQINREVNVVTSKQCFRCQGTGHIAKYCRNMPTCRTCHKVGHEAKDCRVGNSQGNRQ